MIYILFCLDYVTLSSNKARLAYSMNPEDHYRRMSFSPDAPGNEPLPFYLNSLPWCKYPLYPATIGNKQQSLYKDDSGKLFLADRNVGADKNKHTPVVLHYKKNGKYIYAITSDSSKEIFLLIAENLVPKLLPRTKYSLEEVTKP